MQCPCPLVHYSWPVPWQGPICASAQRGDYWPVGASRYAKGSSMWPQERMGLQLYGIQLEYVGFQTLALPRHISSVADQENLMPKVGIMQDARLSELGHGLSTILLCT